MVKGHLPPKIKKGQNACPIQHWTKESYVEEHPDQREGRKTSLTYVVVI